ncbi:uncharacterized protein (DUF427 family) [Nocardia tenerifensis]|uniref:Uncharacterized protein (DUF427 family) n=1 Tax=Nocardia tenerifensis TaxID=228006 RepID=A0A318JX13_9NOCA|nr:DUF427 domain-containing protein [Nocardia tenerifensis]PXX59281.1 uncharacterized protein (DUF427 family) [Nocardia tenerifensis]
MAKATWQGHVIADSDDTIIIEGNHYFPPDSVRTEFLQPSQTTTYCPWKGTASYYTVSVAGETNPDAAWYYPDPKSKAAEIKNYVAFWHGVDVA